MDAFTSDDVKRYSRQLILPQFGPDAQARLKRARVLIVGLGGLGCPAALYLSGAGVGTLGLMDRGTRDGDSIDLSNLHRQVGYTEADVAQARTKPDTLAQALRARNSAVQVRVHDDMIDPGTNATATCAEYDIVLDCTDNVRARYVIGDACAATARTLVSGAAIGLYGQLSVHAPKVTGCYRCVFPTPPPPQCVGSCDAAGVLGPVPGVIGTLMSLECIKVISRFKNATPLHGRLLIFDAADAIAPFRSVKLRSTPREDCIACGPPNIRMDVKTYDYDLFLSGKTKEEVEKEKKDKEIAKACPALIPTPLPRMSVNELDDIRKSLSLLKFSADESENNNGHSAVAKDQSYTLIDVRPSSEFAISHLPDAVNIPLQQLSEQSETLANSINHKYAAHSCRTIIICRRGNASQRALRALLNAGAQNVKDVVGGLQQWSTSVDPTFPMY